MRREMEDAVEAGSERKPRRWWEVVGDFVAALLGGL